MSLTQPEKDMLLQLARDAILRRTEKGRIRIPETCPPSLLKTAASFVTLKKDNELRGCIGSIEAVRPLAEDVIKNAEAAAFHDRRFDPVRKEEAEELRIEISVLHDFKEAECRSMDDLLGRIEPGIHGLVVSYGSRRATFLPSVWKHLKEPDLFFRELLKKAGIDQNCDIKLLKILTYKTEVFNDN